VDGVDAHAGGADVDCLPAQTVDVRDARVGCEKGVIDEMRQRWHENSFVRLLCLRRDDVVRRHGR
jgi:hypothetical protein